MQTKGHRFYDEDQVSAKCFCRAINCKRESHPPLLRRESLWKDYKSTKMCRSEMKLDDCLRPVLGWPRSMLERLESRLHLRARVLWGNVLILTAMHVALPCALFIYGFPVQWQTLVFNYLLYVLSSFGVSGGAHRYWSHRSFSASWPLRLVLMLCFALSGQKTIFGWVRDHRVHHKYVDTDADPHSIGRGFFFAHIGWNIMKKLPDVIRRGNEVDMSDIRGDAIATFYDRHSLTMQLLFSFLLPSAIPYVMWDESLAAAVTWRFFSYLLSMHSTWAINSFAHSVGSRPFNRHIKPTDNYLLSLLIADEGYHNYHHTFPWDYSTSELGYVVSVSVTTPLLHAFRWLGWAYGLKQPSPQLVAAVAARRGDGSRSFVDTQRLHSHEEVPEDANEATVDSTVGIAG